MATERQTMKLARRYRSIGMYVAELELPSSAMIERTLKTRGHHTLWADPEELRRSVRRVILVS